MKTFIKKLGSTVAWVLVSSTVAVMIGGGLAGAWSGYHIGRGNNPVDNPELMNRVASLVASTQIIGALVGLALGLTGKLPGTGSTRDTNK